MINWGMPEICITGSFRVGDEDFTLEIRSTDPYIDRMETMRAVENYIKRVPLLSMIGRGEITRTLRITPASEQEVSKGNVVSFKVFRSSPSSVSPEENLSKSPHEPSIFSKIPRAIVQSIYEAMDVDTARSFSQVSKDTRHGLGEFWKKQQAAFDLILQDAKSIEDLVTVDFKEGKKGCILTLHGSDKRKTPESHILTDHEIEVLKQIVSSGFVRVIAIKNGLDQITDGNSMTLSGHIALSIGMRKDELNVLYLPPENMDEWFMEYLCIGQWIIGDPREEANRRDQARRRELDLDNYHKIQHEELYRDPGIKKNIKCWLTSDIGGRQEPLTCEVCGMAKLLGVEHVLIQMVPFKALSELSTRLASEFFITSPEEFKHRISIPSITLAMRSWDEKESLDEAEFYNILMKLYEDFMSNPNVQSLRIEGLQVKVREVGNIVSFPNLHFTKGELNAETRKFLEEANEHVKRPS